MSKKLQVIILGEPGSGKTTIASAIHANLQSLGINVSFEDDDLMDPMDEVEGMHNIRGLLENGLDVKVSTEQTKREPRRPDYPVTITVHATHPAIARLFAERLALWLGDKRKGVNRKPLPGNNRHEIMHDIREKSLESPVLIIADGAYTSAEPPHFLILSLDAPPWAGAFVSSQLGEHLQTFLFNHGVKTHLVLPQAYDSVEGIERDFPQGYFPPAILSIQELN